MTLTLTICKNLDPNSVAPHTAQGHHKIITAMEAKGNLLYTGGYDNCVKIWDVPSKQLIASGTTVGGQAFPAPVMALRWLACKSVPSDFLRQCGF